MSSGKRSKQAAEVWATEQPRKGFLTSRSNMTFGPYAEDWWVWEKCAYVAKKLAKSRIPHSYADGMYPRRNASLIMTFSVLTGREKNIGP